MSSLAAASSADVSAFVGTRDKTSASIPDDTPSYGGHAEDTLVIKIQDASELLAPSATGNLERYINKNLAAYSGGLIVSAAALVYAVAAGSLGAVVIISIIALGFLDMVVTVAIDKRTSIKR